MEWIKSLTSENILVFLMILVAVVWLFNLFGQGIKTYRELHKPKADEEASVTDRLDSHDKFFATDKRKLEQHDKDIADIREGMKKNCTGIKALLNHQLHDGNTDEMAKAALDLDNWLINR